MVLIGNVTLTGKRPTIIADTAQIKRKLKEIYVPGVGMVPVEEPTSTPVEVNITIVLTEKEEAEMDAVLKKLFDSK
jgi:hypothetical protein